MIELISDLGGGKTTFVKGLAKGIGSTDTVSSPTFTLNNRYAGRQLTLQHFDFYRLQEPGILAEQIREDTADSTMITVVEWADIVHDILPTDRLSITIATTGENSRRYTCNISEKLTYIQEGLSA